MKLTAIGRSPRVWQTAKKDLKRSIAVIAIAATTVAMTACAQPNGGDDPAEGDPNAPIVWGIRDYFEPEAQELIAAYEAEYPDSSVELRLFPSAGVEFRQAVLASRLANDVPDVLATYDTIVEEFANAGVTTDMEYLTVGEGGLEFAEAFVDAYRVIGGEFDGELHGFPQGADAMVVFYNKVHFEEAGLEPPTNDWTWDDFIAASEALTIRDGSGTARYGASFNYHSTAIWNPMLISMGGSPISADGTSAQLNSPEALEVFSMLTQPVLDGIWAPQAVQADQGGTQGPFWNGNASMMLSVRALVPGTRGAMVDDWDVALFPIVNGVRSVGAGSVGISLTAGAEQAAAEQFIRWYYSEAGGMTVLAETYAVVPPVVALYDSPIWRDLPGPPYNNQVFVDAVEAGVLSPELPFAGRGGFEDSLRIAYEEILVGGASVQEAMDRANETATQALRG